MKRMNKGKATGKALLFAAAVMAGVLFLGGTESLAYNVEVTGDSVRVRKDAGTDNEVVGSVKKGDVVEVISEKTASDGKTWYEIKGTNVSGYMISDQSKKTDAAVGQAATDTTSSDTSASETPAVKESEVTPMMTAQSATITTNEVNVRSQASTSASAVAKVNSGTAVTAIGTATDSKGDTWYQVSFIDNGKDVTGFVHSKFVELGEVTGEQNTESEEGEEGASEEDLAAIYGDMPEEKNSDYELVYTAGNDGVEAWFVYDHINNKRIKLDDLLKAEETNANNMEIMEGKVAKTKVVVIILAVLLVLAVAAAGFFGFKYHDLMDDDDDDDEDDDDYDERPARRGLFRRGHDDDDDDEDDDDDDDDDEDDEEDRPVRRRPATSGNRPVRRPAPSENRPVRRTSSEEGRPVRRPASEEGRPVRRPASEEDRPARKRPVSEDGRPVRKAKPTGTSKDGDRPVRKARPVEEDTLSTRRERSSKSDVAWKSKNFLTEDEDDLDFSFIDMNEDK